MALEWERTERLAKEGQSGPAKFHAIVDQLAKDLGGDGLPSPTKACLEEFLVSSKRTTVESTQKRYAHTVKLFLDTLGDAANQPVRNVSSAMIERFLHRRTDSGSAPKTVIVDIKTLNAAFQRAEDLSYIQKNPVPAVKLPKATSTEREVFTEGEVDRLIAAAQNLDWQTLIVLGAYTGARLGDCVAMTWDNIDLNEKVLCYLQKKTGTAVLVPMDTRLISHLHHLSATNADGPLCPVLFGKTPGGKHGLSEGFKRIAKRAGIDVMTVPGKGSRNFAKRTFHSLRHTFSSMLANTGVSEEVRRQLTGHKSSEIHRKYTHLSLVPLRAAMARLRSSAVPTGNR